MNGEALLAGKLNGERLELAAGGDWTADNAAALDALVSAATPQSDTIRNVEIDMGGIAQPRHLWRLAARAHHARRERKAARRRACCGCPTGSAPCSRPCTAPRNSPRRRGTTAISSSFALSTVGRNMVEVQPLVPADRGHARRGHRRVAARVPAADHLPLDLDGQPGRSCRLARGADHSSDHVPDRRDPGAAGHFPFPQLRRRDLCRRHGRHPGAARGRRADRLRDGRRPLRQRLHRRARLHENARGNRRAADHGARSGRPFSSCRASSRW